MARDVAAKRGLASAGGANEEDDVHRGDLKRFNFGTTAVFF